MTDHSVFDGRRQRAVLRKLTRNAGLEATDLAQAVGLSYPQLLRYAYGKVPLRSYQIPVFARAFGVDPLDLSAELGGVDVFEDQTVNPDQPVWSFRTALRGILTESVIDELAPRWERESVINQKAAVQGILEILELERKAATAPPQTRGA